MEDLHFITLIQQSVWVTKQEKKMSRRRTLTYRKRYRPCQTPGYEVRCPPRKRLKSTDNSCSNAPENSDTSSADASNTDKGAHHPGEWKILKKDAVPTQLIPKIILGKCTTKSAGKSFHSTTRRTRSSPRNTRKCPKNSSSTKDTAKPSTKSSSTKNVRSQRHRKTLLPESLPPATTAESSSMPSVSFEPEAKKPMPVLPKMNVVPKDSLPGRLVINNQGSKMPDPNMLLKMLNLPPNVMFNINATSTKVIKKSSSKLPVSSTMTRPVTDSDAEINTKVSDPAADGNEIIIPERVPNPDTLQWIKREHKDYDESKEDIKQQLNIANVGSYLHPAVHMTFECEEQPLEKIKIEPPDDIPDSDMQLNETVKSEPSDNPLQETVEFEMPIRIENIESQSVEDDFPENCSMETMSALGDPLATALDHSYVGSKKRKV